jgi:predicted Zn-dependent peptidase
MKAKVTRLGNGLTVASESMPHLETAAIGVWIGAGSRCESESEHGISHLLEHMAFKGTSRRSARQIAEEIEAVGGEINAATSVENTAYFARVMADDVGLALDILADILTDSVFDPVELQREQHVILQEIGAAQDTPEDHVFDHLQESAFQGQAIGRPILGTAERVAGFTAADLNAYLGRHYRGPEMVVSAAGKVHHDAIVEMAAEKFGRLDGDAAAQPEPATYLGGGWAEARDLQETQITVGFPGASYQSGRHYAAQLLAATLGGGMSSRLFQEAREVHGLCYSISSFHWAYRDTGLFGIHAATGENNVDRLMEVIQRELLRIGHDLEEPELNRARAQMKAGLMMSLESPAARASQIGRQILIHGRPLTSHEILERIDRVHVDEIRAMAAGVFRDTQPTLAMIGPDGCGYDVERFRQGLAG